MRRRGSSPRAPLLRLAFYMDQKIGQRKVLSSASSREVQCEHHLVAGLFVCGKSVLKDSLEVAPAKESWGGGEEELRRLRWFSPPRKLLYYK